jgi:hypothetical protein
MARTRSGFSFLDALVGLGVSGFLMFMLGFTVHRVCRELVETPGTARLQAAVAKIERQLEEAAKQSPHLASPRRDADHREKQATPSDSHGGEHTVSASAAPSRL